MLFHDTVRDVAAAWCSSNDIAPGYSWQESFKYVYSGCMIVNLLIHIMNVIDVGPIMYISGVSLIQVVV